MSESLEKYLNKWTVQKVLGNLSAIMLATFTFRNGDFTCSFVRTLQQNHAFFALIQVHWLTTLLVQVSYMQRDLLLYAIGIGCTELQLVERVQYSVRFNAWPFLYYELFTIHSRSPDCCHRAGTCTSSTMISKLFRPIPWCFYLRERNRRWFSSRLSCKLCIFSADVKPCRLYEGSFFFSYSRPEAVFANNPLSLVTACAQDPSSRVWKVLLHQKP